jgi:hypothetical protein
MLKDIIDVTPLPEYHLRLRFEDGVEGVIDVASLVTFSGVFDPLKDQAYFETVSLNPEIGTICWPNGADLDPEVLYSVISGEALPNSISVSLNSMSTQVKDH